MEEPKIVCLCGSVRFKKEFDEENWALTLSGYIVVQPGCWNHADFHEDNDYSKNTKSKLDELHRAKIRLADIVYIINKDGYIGESTRRELDYARELGKTVWFQEPDKLSFHDQIIEDVNEHMRFVSHMRKESYIELMEAERKARTHAKREKSQS